MYRIQKTSKIVWRNQDVIEIFWFIRLLSELLSLLQWFLRVQLRFPIISTKSTNPTESRRSGANTWVEKSQAIDRFQLLIKSLRCCTFVHISQQILFYCIHVICHNKSSSISCRSLIIILESSFRLVTTHVRNNCILKMKYRNIKS